MLLDANILLYAVDTDSAFHQRARQVLEHSLGGDERVGMPWQTIGAFLRLSTNPRVLSHPMTAADAWEYVDEWLGCDVTWIPPATSGTARVLAALIEQVPVTGNLVTDAMLAALALEHGVELWSNDSDFARFPGLRWHNPLAN